jgi:hypothetical protein
MELFSREQIFIGLFDDLKNDARKFSYEIFDFLEIKRVDMDFKSSDTLKSSVPKNRIFSIAVKKSATILRSAGFPTIVERFKRTKVASGFYIEQPYDLFSTISAEKDYLLEYFTDDIATCAERVNLI